MRSPIDYTKRRKSALQKIDRCPKCGRKGHTREYRDGSVMYVHRIEYPPPYHNGVVTDHCMVIRTD